MLIIMPVGFIEALKLALVMLFKTLPLILNSLKNLLACIISRPLILFCVETSRIKSPASILPLNFSFLAKSLWIELNKKFECINADNPKTAYYEYLSLAHAVRFSKKGTFIPNIELKFPKVELDDWTLEKRKEILLNKQRIFISPLELQIPFKLFLGSEKDIEDARFLYQLLKDKIDIELLKKFNKKLNIERLFKKYLR